MTLQQLEDVEYIQHLNKNIDEILKNIYMRLDDRKISHQIMECYRMILKQYEIIQLLKNRVNKHE